MNFVPSPKGSTTTVWAVSRTPVHVPDVGHKLDTWRARSGINHRLNLFMDKRHWQFWKLEIGQTLWKVIIKWKWKWWKARIGGLQHVANIQSSQCHLWRKRLGYRWVSRLFDLLRGASMPSVPSVTGHFLIPIVHWLNLYPPRMPFILRSVHHHVDFQ